jgi:hypothetical protein
MILILTKKSLYNLIERFDCGSEKKQVITQLKPLHCRQFLINPIPSN